MILISEIATKLNNILNGTDESVVSLVRPTDFEFSVATEGFHLDKLGDKATGKNFIPVFISQGGGEYDAIPNLRKCAFSIPVAIYFPVRFKNDFFALNDFLSQALVGKVLNWGENSQNCLSTISVATFGEIQGLDLNQFKTWVQDVYQETIDVMEMYMSMTFTIYLTNAIDVLWGNQVSFSMQFTYNGTTYPNSTDFLPISWSQSGSQLQNNPSSQQLLGVDNYTKNIIDSTTRSRSFLAYVENNDTWKKLIEIYNNGTTNLITSFKIKKTYGFATPISYTYTDVVLSLNESVALGEPLSFTITLGDGI